MRAKPWGTTTKTPVSERQHFRGVLEDRRSVRHLMRAHVGPERSWEEPAAATKSNSTEGEEVEGIEAGTRVVGSG